MIIRTLVVRSFISFGAVAVVLLLAVLAISQQRLTAVYSTPSVTLPVPTNAAAIARGEHIVKAIGTCGACHGPDFGGAIYADMPLVGIVAGPNLTGGAGGIASTMRDGDWVRALRYGVRRDGTSLIAMPSEVFTHFTDADLGAVVAYLKQLPPVDREIPATHFRILGRAMLVVGKLNILTAPKTRHEPAMGGVPAPTAGYGAYLAHAAGCAGCHGAGFSGGRVAGPPHLPLAANITPAGIGAWSESDFARVLREGRRPDGRAVDEFMPWRYYGQMSDMEMHALWLYLRGLPPRASGNK